MIILTYLPRRKNKRSKHIRIPGSPERRFFFGGAGFWVENEKVWARPKNIHRTIFPGNIYIYIIFPGRRPGLRIFQYESVLPTHFGVQQTPPILLVLMFWGYWVPWGHWLHCFLERLIWEPWRLLRDALVLHILQGWKKNTWHLKRCVLIILKEQVFHIFWVHRMVTTTDPKDRPFLTTCTILLITWFPWRFYFLWVQLVLVVLL